MDENYDCALTTHDNPYDPFDDFVSWFLFDTEKGYNCCARLARIAQITDDMSQIEIDREKERAIDEIIQYDVAGIYTKVVKQLAVA